MQSVRRFLTAVHLLTAVTFSAVALLLAAVSFCFGQNENQGNIDKARGVVITGNI